MRLLLLLLFNVLWVCVVLCVPSPPQQEQYVTKISTSGSDYPENWYADWKQLKERADVPINEQEFIIRIFDYRLNQTFEIEPDNTCFSSPLQGNHVPFLYFPFNQYQGVVACNNTKCNQWTGCHPYEVPPAPFLLTATASDNIPIHLSLFSLGRDYYFYNFKLGPPKNGTFSIPNNCTEISHPKYPSSFEKHRKSNIKVQSPMYC